MKRPSIGAIVLGLIPFGAICFSVSLWDRIHPIIFGLPFNFFWLILWTLLTPVCMGASYLLSERREAEVTREQDGQN